LIVRQFLQQQIFGTFLISRYPDSILVPKFLFAFYDYGKFNFQLNESNIKLENLHEYERDFKNIEPNLLVKEIFSTHFLNEDELKNYLKLKKKVHNYNNIINIWKRFTC